MTWHERARRELLLQGELQWQEESAKAVRLEHAREVEAIRRELEALKATLLRQEVESANELERQRLRALSDAEVAKARRRLEHEVRALEEERSTLRTELHATRGDLDHSREARVKAEERLQMEREAHATWEAHRDEQMLQLRERLVARTEQMLQVGLQLDSAVQPPPSHEQRATANTARDGGGASPMAVLSLVAEELRHERDAHRCCVCMHAERSTVLLPCKHAVLCPSCADTVRQTSGRCPLCRVPVTEVIRVYS